MSTSMRLTASSLFKSGNEYATNCETSSQPSTTFAKLVISKNQVNIAPEKMMHALTIKAFGGGAKQTL